MEIKPMYDSLSDVPSMYKEAYEEKDGKAVLSKPIEIKTDADVQAVLDAKGHIKTELTEAKEKLKQFDGIDVEKYKQTIDEMDILRAKVKEGTSEEQIADIVKARVERMTEALTKEKSDLVSQLEQANGVIHKAEKQSTLEQALKGKIDEKVMDDARYIIGSVLERQADGSFMSNGNGGFDKGLGIEDLVSKAIEGRQHWQPQNVAGGATGSTANKATVSNPFSKKTLNYTEQHKLMKSDPAMAKTLQEQAKLED